MSGETSGQLDHKEANGESFACKKKLTETGTQELRALALRASEQLEGQVRRDGGEKGLGVQAAILSASMSPRGSSLVAGGAEPPLWQGGCCPG